jgi:hypothetical protein
MANFKDKNFVATKAIEYSAANKASSFGEHEIFATFEADVYEKYNKNLKILNTLVQGAKNLCDKIFVPVIECMEEVEMNNTLKSYDLQDQKLQDEECKILDRKRFAENKIRIQGSGEIEGSRWPCCKIAIFVLVLLVIESVINSQLLIQASQEGLFGGARKAFYISLVSVVVSFICGISFQRLYAYGYPVTLKRISASLVLSGWIAFSVIFHFSVGWYRYALEGTEAAKANTEWIRLLMDNNLFGQQDFWAWILTIAGLLLAIEAFHLGTQWSSASLLWKLANIENNYKNIKTSRFELRKSVKLELEKIKNETIEQDLTKINNLASHYTTPFELKRLEILQLCKLMNQYVESANKDIVTYTDIWRSNYSSQTPDSKFNSQIGTINSNDYRLDTNPLTQWVMSKNNDHIQSTIHSIREARVKEITQTYKRMCERLNGNGETHQLLITQGEQHEDS